MEFASIRIENDSKGFNFGGGGATINDLSPFKITKVPEVFELGSYWSEDRSCAHYAIEIETQVRRRKRHPTD